MQRSGRPVMHGGGDVHVRVASRDDTHENQDYESEILEDAWRERKLDERTIDTGL